MPDSLSLCLALWTKQARQRAEKAGETVRDNERKCEAERHRNTLGDTERHTDTEIRTGDEGPETTALAY